MDFSEQLFLGLILIAEFFMLLWLVLWLSRPKKAVLPKNSFEPKITVIIPAKNEEKAIHETISRVLASDYPTEKMQVIAINDGSSDATEREMRRHASKIRIISHEKSRGKARSINEALRLASGEIIVMMDSDTLIEKESVRELLRGFSSPKVAAVSGVVKIKNSGLLERFQMIDYFQGMFLRLIQDEYGAVPTTIGVFCAMRKKALLEIGGISSDTLAEDADACLTLRERGYLCRIIPVVVSTIAPEKVSDLYRQRRRWVQGKIQLADKHRNLIFNAKYGALGMFTFPYEYIGMAIALVSFPISLLQLWYYLQFLAAIAAVIALILFVPSSSEAINTGLSNLFALFNPFKYGLVGVISTTFIALSFVFIFLSIRAMGQKQKLSHYFLFLFSYPYIILLFFTTLTGTLRELRRRLLKDGSEQKLMDWGTRRK